MSDGSREGFVRRTVALTDSETDVSQPDVREGLMISFRKQSRSAVRVWEGEKGAG